jgi:AcrR family transcriptional regulator
MRDIVAQTPVADGYAGAMPTTRDKIFDAARTLFAEKGYAGTPVRDIATAAGVDPALVIRHFTSKEQLFLETMHLDELAQPLLGEPLETLGERFIEFMFNPDEQVKGVFLALVRASDSEGVESHLRQRHEHWFVAPLLTRLDGPDAELRARLAAALVGGLLYSLWVVGDEALLAADRSQLVTLYGGLLQSLLTPS